FVFLSFFSFSFLPPLSIHLSSLSLHDALPIFTAPCSSNFFNVRYKLGLSIKLCGNSSSSLDNKSPPYVGCLAKNNKIKAGVCIPLRNFDIQVPPDVCLI